MFFGGYGFHGPSSPTTPTSPTKTGLWGNNPTSPFRTTHMPLQEITMNQTYFPTGTSRSPGKASAGSSALNGGRTMKDYEDQLGALQKENFNLKLRVYFLEEKMNISSADENSVKNNIELKVEVESLKKELLEKQELLSQAAKAFQLHEEQKEASARDQAQYQQSLEQQKQRIQDLEHELEDLKERTINPSLYYETTFGITPESAIENREKLQQLQEFVESLEAEVRQLTSSLNEERTWGQEIENERDELKKRLDNEIRIREKITIARDDDNELLRTKIKELEDIGLKRETLSQQYKNELAEKDRIIKEKISLVEEKYKACEELESVTEKRQKQIEYLRALIKAKDETITELTNKNRLLHTKLESSLTRRLSPPGSPVGLGDTSSSSRSSQRSAFIGNSPNSLPAPFNWDGNQEKIGRISPQITNDADDKIKNLTKELEERNCEIKKQEDLRKQLMIKLCNVEESSSTSEKELKKIKLDYEKALQSIQDLVERQSKSEDKQNRKDRKIVELQQEIMKLRSLEIKRIKSAQLLTTGKTTNNDNLSENNQQRFEDMEIMINELRNEIENIRTEKNELEKQIHIEAEELRHESQEKQKMIDYLEKERDEIKQNLIEKDSEISRLKIDFNFLDNELPQSIVAEEKERLEQELLIMSKEVEEKDKKIDQLSKELDKKTQNLQQLVNTELWSKNKEIAKLHNHMTANQTQSINSQLDILLNELQKIKINVKFIDNNVELNYENDKKDLLNIETMENYIEQLTIKKLQLEKDVEYFKWIKLISKSDDDDNNNEYFDLKNNNNVKYCELLKNHMTDLMKFMKEMIKKSNYSSTNEYKKMILDLLVGSEILSEDFVNALNGITVKQLTMEDICTCKDQQLIDKTCSIVGDDLPGSAQSDSESFSEPDRKVSLARIGLQDVQKKSLHRSRFTKCTKQFSDSEDSIDYIPYHKTFQNDLIDIDASHQIQELKETNGILYNELNELHNELLAKKIDENLINEKLLPIIMKLEKSQDYCQKLQITFDKKINDNTLFIKNNNKQKQQFDKKYINIDNNKDIKDKKTYELITLLNKENDLYKKRITKIDNEYKLSKDTITTLTKELDRLTLSHSQVLVENTKLTNDKLRLDQQIRKSENKYDLIINKMQEKFDKELSDLNQIIDSHRVRIFELENINKELRRQVVICETSDSAPSSSGISSIPADINKQSSSDVLQNYNNYRGSQYWMTMNYQLSNGRSKSSCSPDLGIESDAAVSTTRPLKDTLKITESMTNLLSDEENCNNDNPNSQDLDRESPLHLEGLDEMEALKKENISLKKRLTKTKRALEDTFEHLSASNKNKKNVEKAITKQLSITKSILKKTRTYEEPLDN
ncbi:hypothetical protein HCN44_009363 [Aphidius gifuensis]|uniref:Centrosomin N-terminal motif 1 domain-containing protein n=1 Tax=Aphidius gifuensis TaxID=684658 RepID=A0A834Y250_APHGI|nr:centrosomin isoform X3 [Aphidius gifuensis]KAF7997965.1 hypothetical protein HCN44_009363 [Aphidius gifuensis]